MTYNRSDPFSNWLISKWLILRSDSFWRWSNFKSHFFPKWSILSDSFPEVTNSRSNPFFKCSIPKSIIFEVIDFEVIHSSKWPIFEVTDFLKWHIVEMIDFEVTHFPKWPFPMWPVFPSDMLSKLKVTHFRMIFSQAVLTLSEPVDFVWRSKGNFLWGLESFFGQKLSASLVFYVNKTSLTSENCLCRELTVPKSLFNFV